MYLGEVSLSGRVFVSGDRITPHVVDNFSRGHQQTSSDQLGPLVMNAVFWGNEKLPSHIAII